MTFNPFAKKQEPQTVLRCVAHTWEGVECLVCGCPRVRLTENRALVKVLSERQSKVIEVVEAHAEKMRGVVMLRGPGMRIDEGPDSGKWIEPDFAEGDVVVLANRRFENEATIDGKRYDGFVIIFTRDVLAVIGEATA